MMTSRLPSWQLTVVIVAIATAVIVLGLIPGWTQWAYEWLWMNTTGEPYTFIMRRNPHLLFIPTFLVLAALARCLPHDYSARVLLIWATYAVGLLAGHVIWGEGVINLPD